MNSKPRLIDWLPKLAGANVVCVGDVMLDRFVYGEVERISPEAPIPVLRVAREAVTVGGAGNVARNLSALGVPTHLFGAVGDDPAGREAAEVLSFERQVRLSLVTDKERPTTVKTRFIAGGQQLLRTDEEQASALAGDAQDEIVAAVKSAVADGDCGALVLSDYGKGVLTDEVVAAATAAANAAGVPVLIDPKGVDFSRYRGASIVTPNRRELGAASQMPVDSDVEVVAAARQLIETCGLGAIIATRGPDGMTVVSEAGDVHLPAMAREVFDVSGAGDTVVASVSAGLAAGMQIAEAAQLANVAAGIVVGKVGTAVVRLEELSDGLGGAAGLSSKILGTADLADRIAQWRARGLSVGFTNGCFDIVHPGHISLIEQASAACDRLIVALNDDASVRGLKGEGRPVQPQDARARVIASLAGVDAVVLFGEDTPLALIEVVKPDVLVKGADYSLDEVVGGDVVTANGGRVVLADLVDGFSTTDTISRIAG